jgi:hypothetical protein
MMPDPTPSPRIKALAEGDQDLLLIALSGIVLFDELMQAYRSEYPTRIRGWEAERDWLVQSWERTLMLVRNYLASCPDT